MAGWSAEVIYIAAQLAPCCVAAAKLWVHTRGCPRKSTQAVARLGFRPTEVYEPWLPTDVCQQGIVALQSLTGDSALAILAAALIVRLATWPLNVRALQRQCDRIDLLPVYMALAKELQEAKKMQGGLAATAAAGALTRADSGGVGAAEVAKAAERAQADIERVTVQITDFQKTFQFNPLQGMGYQVFCLMPMYILFYCSVRGIMAHPDAFRNFVVEPSMWLDSLVLADPLGIMPVVSACSVLLNVEMNSPPPRDGQEDTALYFRFVIRGAVLAFVPLTSMLSSSMLVFMATNAAYTAIVTFVFRKYFWVPPRIEPRWLALSKAKLEK